MPSAPVVAATFSGSLGTDNKMTITFSEAVESTTGGDLATGDFVVSATGGLTVSSFSVAKTSASVYVITPTFSGSQPSGSESLSVDVGSNKVITTSNAAAVAQDAQTATLHERIPPTFVAAVATDNTVVIDFNEDVSRVGGGSMTTADLLCTISGGTATLSSYTITANTVRKFTLTLTLSGVPDGSEAVTVNVGSNKVGSVAHCLPQPFVRPNRGSHGADVFPPTCRFKMARETRRSLARPLRAT